jgi:hypothetical protein
MDVIGSEHTPVTDFGVKCVEPSATGSTALKNIIECITLRGRNLDT